MRVGGQGEAPAALPPGKRVPVPIVAQWAQGRSGRVRKISPPARLHVVTLYSTKNYRNKCCIFKSSTVVLFRVTDERYITFTPTAHVGLLSNNHLLRRSNLLHTVRYITMCTLWYTTLRSRRYVQSNYTHYGSHTPFRVSIHLILFPNLTILQDITH